MGSRIFDPLFVSPLAKGEIYVGCSRTNVWNVWNAWNVWNSAARFGLPSLALSKSIAYQNIRGLHYLRRSPEAHFNVATKNRGGAHEKR